VSGSVALDLTLLLLLALYAWSGWRQGFVSALLGLVGLVGGAVLAVRLVPGLLEDHAGIHQDTPAGLIALLAAVVVFALLGQGLMLLLARRFRDVVTAPAARAVDSALGLLAVLVTAMLVVWVVAGAVSTAGPLAARDLVSRSVVVSALDEIVPSSADGLVENLTQALDRGVFPKVFEGLGPEPIAPVEAPDGAVTTDPDVARAVASVVHVRAESDDCGQAQVGSGWVVAPGRIATNAHVVAGADRVTVSVRGTGRERAARVVAFDPQRDVAVLDVDDLNAPVLQQGAALETGAQAALAGFPGDKGLWVGAARVRDVLQARGADIYGNPDVSRRIYSLRAEVRRGASGGPVIDRDGEVVGMVFATSLDDPETGYALTLDEIQPVLRRGVLTTRAVPTGECLSG
jgi:S1-C subfamily serine protease